MFGLALCRRYFAVACALFCVATVGCAHCKNGPAKIDPNRRQLTAIDIPYKQVPNAIGVHDMTAVMVTPSKVIAPVGSEVVVQAAVCGQDKTLMAGKKVEWSIAPNSVGHFVQAGETGPLDWMHHVGYHTKKIDNTYAVSATSAKFIMLNRGTPTPSDDVPILRGQAWTTVTSPMEGTSYVTAVAPDVYAWHSHKQTAKIHWVDSQWTFPAPSINPTGTRHAFTTTVVRHSNNCPLVGWRVRYQIASGPQAGFAPDGSQVVEVVTNSLGQATAEIFQTNPLAGTNVINVAVIRPADWPSSDGSPLVVGSGVTQMTWTTTKAGGGLWIDQTGPSEATVGTTLTYRIVVRNPSDLTAKGLVVTENIPTGLTLVGSTPQPQVAGNALTWVLGDLAGGQSRQIELTFQANSAAVVNSCSTVRSADGSSAQDCAVTTITSPSVELTLVGPPQATVNEEITFVANITNRGSQAVGNLTLVDRFEPGLRHEQAGSGPIENRDLGTLAPGETRRVNVRLRVLQPGRWCNTMELTGDNGVRTSAQACVTAVAAPTGTPPVVVPPPSNPPVAGNAPQLVVRKSGPTRAAVGEKVLFTILVENRGNVPATNVKVLDNYDAQFLNALQASDGWQRAGNDIFWTLPTLPPNYSYKREVEAVCIAAGQNVCNRVTVTTQEGTRQDAQACLEITGTRAPLSVSIFEPRDPVSNGQEAAYDVRVTNNSPVSDREVLVVVTLPEQMTPAPSTGQTQYALNGRTMRFAPVAELRAGETLTYQIRGTARQPIDAAQFRVDVTSAASPQPITATETTRIVP